MLRAKAASGVLWTSAQGLYTNAFSIAVLAVLARLLEPEAFGVVAMASVFVAFASIFMDQGIGESLVQRAELDPRHLDAGFWANVAMGLACFTAGMLLAGPVAALFGEPEVRPIVQGLSFSFLGSAVAGVPTALLRRNFQFKKLATASMLASTAGGCIGIGMALRGHGAMSLVAQTVARSAVLAVCLAGMVEWWPRMRFSYSHFREVAGFGMHIVGIRFMSFVNRRADDMLIGYWLGPVALGYYTVGYRLVFAATGFFTGVLNSVALPAFSHIQNEPLRVREAVLRSTRLAAILAVPGFTLAAVLSPWIIPALYGAGWEESVRIMQVLSLIGIVHSIEFIHGTVMVAMGRPGWKLRLTMLNAVMNLILFSIFVHYGVLAVAIAYVARGYALTPISVFVTRRLTGLNIKQYIYHLGPGALIGLATAVAGTYSGQIIGVYAPAGVTVVVASLVGLAAGVCVLRLMFGKLYLDISGLLVTGLGRRAEKVQ